MTPYVPLNIDYLELIQDEVSLVLDSQQHQPSKTDVFFFDQHLYTLLPNLQRLLKSLGVTPNIYMYVVVEPHTRLMPHRDFADEPWSLLVPIRNTKNTLLTFYDHPSDPILKTAINGNGEETCWWWVNPADCTITHEIEVLQPMLIRTDVTHDVINNTDLRRETLSMKLPTSFKLS